MKDDGKGNQYAIAALKHRRAKLMGEIKSLQDQAAWKQRQLEHVDGALEIFGATDPEKIKPVKAYKRVMLFKQGELSRLVRDVLRRAKKPLTTPEVVRAVMTDQDHDEAAWSAMYPRVRGTLAYLSDNKGVLVKTGEGRGAKWALKTAKFVVS